MVRSHRGPEQLLWKNLADWLLRRLQLAMSVIEDMSDHLTWNQPCTMRSSAHGPVVPAAGRQGGKIRQRARPKTAAICHVLNGSNTTYDFPT
jgi:hypothetical protein